MRNVIAQREPVAASPLQVAGAPRVTIGMPVYNSARWLRSSIESILSQTWHDLELVVSDNASTDGSFEIAQQYARHDERVRVYRNPVNRGVNYNYTVLVGYARGEYFKWASSSDMCAPTFIEKCVAVLDAQTDVGLCYPKTRLFVECPESGEEYRIGVQTLENDPVARFRHVLEHIGLNNAINGLIRMVALRSTGLIRPHYSSDITLIAELALWGKILELPECLFYRRFEQNTATALQDTVRVRQFHFPGAGLGMYFQAWRRCWGYVSAIRRARLSPTQRIRGLQYVARRYYSAQRELLADVREAMTELCGMRRIGYR